MASVPLTLKLVTFENFSSPGSKQPSTYERLYFCSFHLNFESKIMSSQKQMRVEMSEWFQWDLITCFKKQLKIIPFSSAFYFSLTFFTIWMPENCSTTSAHQDQQSPGSNAEIRSIWSGLMSSPSLSGRVTQTYTARRIANLPLKPFSLISL